jgi:hypothetical protein
MKMDLPKPDWGSMSSVKLNDCWNKIGVWGNRECGELKHAIHCRNCIVYSSAAAQPRLLSLATKQIVTAS